MNMNVNEFGSIASAMKAAYPNANLMPDNRAKEVWYTMLSDLDYSICLAALKEHISLNKFAPSISEIREKYAGIITGEEKDWGAAWKDVLYAIRRWGMYREREAMDSLDNGARQCVGRLGFKNLCLSEDLNIDRANFRMIYEQVSTRRKEYTQLAPALQEEKRSLHELVQNTVVMLEGNDQGSSKSLQCR